MERIAVEAKSVTYQSVLEELRAESATGAADRGWIMVAIVHRLGSLASPEEAEQARAKLLAEYIDSESWIAVRMLGDEIEVTISQRYGIFDWLSSTHRIGERQASFSRATVPMHRSDYDSEMTNLHEALEALASMPVNSGISFDSWVAIVVNGSCRGTELRDFVRINQSEQGFVQLAEFLAYIFDVSFPQVGAP